MTARIPLDVDLDDKLLYGLTPMRLGYVVLGLLAAFALWNSAWAPLPLRAPVALAAALIGAFAGWGRWRGRAADAWIVDVAWFVIANVELQWKGPQPWRRIAGH